MVWDPYPTPPLPPTVSPKKVNNIPRSHLLGGDSGWSETYIHISLQHELMFPNLNRNSGWYIVT